MDQELNAFKSRIDLREYAASLGYELDRKESSRSSSVMRQAGDKIVIKRNANSHYVFFSLRDDADNGTLIDFVQRRKNLNLGQLRKELRPWIGRPAQPLPLFAKLEASPEDRRLIERNYAQMKITGRYRYLEDERKLPPALLGSPRFAGRIRIDEHANVVFPHFDRGGLCGYELKNHKFTGFSPGGEKGLWESHDRSDDTAIVFAEGAIDALSHAALFPAPGSRYRSIGGAVNPKQPELIKLAMVDMPVGAAVICATDNDDAGHKLATMIETCFKSTCRADLTFTLHFPEVEGSDWNQTLQVKALSLLSSSSFPIASLSPR